MDNEIKVGMFAYSESFGNGKIIEHDGELCLYVLTEYWSKTTPIRKITDLQILN